METHSERNDRLITRSKSSPTDTSTGKICTLTPVGRPSFNRYISHELETSLGRRNQFSSIPFHPFTTRRHSLREDSLGQTALVRQKIIIEETKQPYQGISGPFRQQKRDMSVKNARETGKGDQDENEEQATTVLSKEPELIPLITEEEEIREFDKTMERRLIRARKLRRTTVMHYDQQEDTFRRRRAPQLFELAVLIELEPNDGSNERLFPLQEYHYVPKVSFVYPSKPPPHLQPLLTTLPALCYADLSRARPEDPERYKDEQFLMIITDTSGDRKYAYCHRFTPVDLSKYTVTATDQTATTNTEVESRKQTHGSERVLPQILCIVTPVNAPSFYYDLSHEAALRAKSGHMDMLNTFLNQSFRQRLPPANGFVTVKLNDDNNDEQNEGAETGWEVVLMNRSTPKKGHGLGELLDRLGIDRLLKLFCALLCEKRVLLVADSVPLLSRCVQSASAMLVPFSWPHTLIPIVPDPFLHLCFSPAPYLMGVLRDNLSAIQPLLQDNQGDLESQEEYILIMDVDRAIILKDKDWAPTGITDLLTSSKLLPNRITRSLKQLLKSALKSTERREEKSTEAFHWTFIELVGHYMDHMVMTDEGKAQFDLQAFVNAPSSRSQRNFLKLFVETGMFQVWINTKLEACCNGETRPSLLDAFDRKVEKLRSASSDLRGWSWARF